MTNYISFDWDHTEYIVIYVHPDSSNYDDISCLKVKFLQMCDF